MKCWLTENARLYVVLRELSSGYETGDFKSFFPFLADDCVLESQWVLMPNEGKDSVIKYLKGKGKTLKRTKSFPMCCVYEIIGDITTVTNATVTTDFRSYEKASLSLMHTPGKLCLMLTQKLENETVNMVIDVTLGDDGLVRRIDLCNPDFYRCRPFETYVRLNPGDEVVDEDDDSVLVPEEYYPEMYTFLSMADVDFDEYDEVKMPMDKWIVALRYWDRFYATGNFDEVFEELAEVSYVGNSWEIKNQEAACKLSRFGKRIWDNRAMGKILLKRLLEWTELYRNDYDYIVSEGW